MRNIRYKDIQGGCMNIQGGIRWSAVNIRMYSERSLYKDMGMSIRKAVRDIRMGKEGGRRRVGGYVTRHCDFPNGHRNFSQASIAILKACGSDNLTAKIESLIPLAPLCLDRK